MNHDGKTGKIQSVVGGTVILKRLSAKFWLRRGNNVCRGLYRLPFVVSKMKTAFYSLCLFA